MVDIFNENEFDLEKFWSFRKKFEDKIDKKSRALAARQALKLAKQKTKKEKQFNVYRPFFVAATGFMCALSFILALDLIYCVECSNYRREFIGIEFAVAMSFLGGICGLSGHILRGLFR